MKKRNLYLLLTLSFLLFFSQTITGAPIRVACVRNSITNGTTISNRKKNSYPVQLQEYFGQDYEITIWGLNSITQVWRGNRKAFSCKSGKKTMAQVVGKDHWKSADISGDRTPNFLWRIRCGSDNSCHP